MSRSFGITGGNVAAQIAKTPGSSLSMWSAGGCETLPRFGLIDIDGVSGRLDLTYAVAPVTVTINTLAIACRGPAVGATLARLAIFTVAANGDVTKVAQTANVPTMSTAGYTAVQQALATAGGFPGSYTLTAGEKYAFGWLNVASTSAAQIRGMNADLEFLSPIVNRYITGQADIAASYTNAQLSNGYQPRLIAGFTP